MDVQSLEKQITATQVPATEKEQLARAVLWLKLASLAEGVLALVKKEIGQDQES